MKNPDFIIQADISRISNPVLFLLIEHFQSERHSHPLNSPEQRFFREQISKIDREIKKRELNKEKRKEREINFIE